MTSTDLIVLPLPETGELVPLSQLVGALGNGAEVALNGSTGEKARYVEALRVLDREVATIKRLLQGAIAEDSKTWGSKTLRVDGLKLVVKQGTSTSVDAEKLAASYRRAGMPEERVEEIVVTTVTLRVDLVKAKQAAAANPKYASALKRASTTTETPVSVSIERG